MAALVAPPEYKDERKPVSPSSTSTRNTNSFGTDEPSVSSKTHEISQSASTMSVESAAIPSQSVVVEPQKEEPRKIGRWYIGETLGKGGYSWVKKGRDEKNGKFVALKFVDRKKANGKFSSKRAEQIKTEITVLKNIKHPNIVRLFAYNMKAKYPERDDNTPPRDVMLLVLEYMSGGELFDILYYTNALSEVLARTYFHQLMAGVEALHSRHINHRDLKPQNLLLDKRYILKISDFGLSKIMAPNEDGMMHTYKVGTRGYQSPEIILNKPYTSACDIFACGVILFLLLTGYPPFQTAAIEDRWYGNIARGKVKKFWKQHRGCGLGPYAIDLVTRMLAFDPNQRITLDGIKKHPWYNEEIINNGKDLKRLIQLRHTQMEVKRANDPIKQQILVASEKFRGLGGNGNGNGGQDDEKAKELMSDLMVPKPLPEEDGIGIFDVFTTHSAYEVLSYIQEFSKLQFSFTPAIDKESCALVIRTAFQSDSISADESMCEALISVYKYEEYKCNLVKFVKMSGNHVLWRKTYQQLMVWLRPVLDGVPKEVEKEKFAINDNDTKLLTKYFTSPKDSALKGNNNNNNNNNNSKQQIKQNDNDNKNNQRSSYVDKDAVSGVDFDYAVDYDESDVDDVKQQSVTAQ